jgi:hypothetical protein
MRIVFEGLVRIFSYSQHDRHRPGTFAGWAVKRARSFAGFQDQHDAAAANPTLRPFEASSLGG